MIRSRDNAATLRLSAIEEEILTVLLERERYGLEIMKLLNIGRSYPLTVGSIYPVLNRLVKKEFLVWRLGGEEDGTHGAPRKYYKMLDLGIFTLKGVQSYRAKLLAGKRGNGFPSTTSSEPRSPSTKPLTPERSIIFLGTTGTPPIH
jgi:PadR family transcriptional regulator, regulatory protein PadR